MRRKLFLFFLVCCIAVAVAQNRSNGNTTITENANGSKTMTVKSNCLYCLSTGVKICACCVGTGAQKVLIGYGYDYFPIYDFVSCQCCKGQKQVVCSACSGKGYIVNSYTIYPNAPVIPNTGSSNYSGSYDNKASGSTRKKCSGCNGTGKGVDKIIYAPNYTGKNNDEYCSQCGSVKSAHSHHSTRCSGCHGKGYIEY
ncbi:MAG: hypothetical protein LBM06_08015 [Prevotellaceae bacterium]|nr:hypothetical protein [Prevotellaceae bacterium]